MYFVDISGDDEQSDWFGEAVGAKGWWADSDRDEDMEPTFQAILTGNLETYRMLADRMASFSLHLYITMFYILFIDFYHSTSGDN